jgi:outer membrane translocation and assembly module TamA
MTTARRHRIVLALAATLFAAAAAGPATVDLAVAVEAGPLVTIQAVRIEGVQQTREAFIRKRLKLNPGDRCDWTLERESSPALSRGAGGEGRAKGAGGGQTRKGR